MKKIFLLVLLTMLLFSCNQKDPSDETKVTTAGTVPEEQTFKGNTSLGSTDFFVEFNSYSGAINKLICNKDETRLNYVCGLDTYSSRNTNGDKWFGDVDISYKTDGGDYKEVSTSYSSDIRKCVKAGKNSIGVSYAGKSGNDGGLDGIEVNQTWTVEGNKLIWSTELVNSCGSDITLGSVSFPLMFNSGISGTQKEMYENFVYNHSFIGYNDTYFYVCRNSGEGPVLLLYPTGDTSVEYQYWRGNLNCSSMYVIAGNSQEQYPDSSYLDLSTADLPDGGKITFSFEMKWCESTSGINATLEESGKTGFVSLPGMVTATDLPVSLALLTKKEVRSIKGEFDGTEIGDLGEQNKFSISFSHLGQNRLDVEYNDGTKTSLLYFVTEPLETLIEKNTSFISENQQQNDIDDPCYKGFLPWDMVMYDLTGDGLLDANNYQTEGYFPTGWWHYGGDEMGFSPALYLSLKNVYSPDEKQLKQLVDYINVFIFDGMTEKFEDGTYRLHRGAPWYIMGDWPGDERIDRELIRTNFDCWRSYNYLHVINTYYNMYRIFSYYDFDIEGMLPREEYLKRAYDLCYTFFTAWMYPKGEDERGQGAVHYGNMGESMFPEILDALGKEGFDSEYKWLKKQLEDKAEYFSYEEYPYSAEGGFDTAAYESVYAYALFSGNKALADEVTKVNKATRGQTPVWYLYGSDLPNQDKAVNLRYMTQLGGWSLLSHALNFAEGTERENEIRLAYGSYLAGWSLINSGYWSEDSLGSSVWYYQGIKGNTMDSVNDWEKILPVYNGAVAVSGESSLGFWAGLNMASTVVTNDSVFGLYAYGGKIGFSGDKTSVIPMDGVRKRIVFADSGITFELLQDKISELTCTAGMSEAGIMIENVSGTDHLSTVSVSGREIKSVLVDGESIVPDGSGNITFRMSGSTAEIKIVFE